MTEKLELYKCEVCGNIVEVIITGAGELVCCGQPMNLLTAHTDEEIKGESHLPFMYYDEEGKEVIQIGEKVHPMLPEHHIEFIQTISEDGKTSVLHFLEAGEEPKAYVKENLGNYIAREHCNLHGLWAKIITHNKE